MKQPGPQKRRRRSPYRRPEYSGQLGFDYQLFRATLRPALLEDDKQQQEDPDAVGICDDRPAKNAEETR